MAARKRLTKAVVDKLPTGSYAWDAEVRGFCVRKQTRDPIFLLKYRIHGRQRWVTIGIHGSPWTVETARKEAQRLLGEVAKGRDPATERDRMQVAPIVAELAERFLELHAEAKLKPGTVANYRYQIRLYLSTRDEAAPAPERGATGRPRKASVSKAGRTLARLKVEAVTVSDISRLHHELRSTPYEANRVLALLSKMFAWAELHGYRERGTSPCVGIERYREHRRERFLSQDELARLGEVLSDCENSGSESPWTVAAIRLLIFTGARLSEIAGLRWEHVDLERGLLLLPDSKTGRKAVHLSAPAAAVLASVPRIDSNPFVVVGAKAGEHATDIGERWRRIRVRAYIPDVRAHDLRHSFASVAAGRGGSLPMIGKLLGHTQAATTARYAHLAADPVRELNEAAGATLAAALRSKEKSKTSAQVVPLKTTA